MILYNNCPIHSNNQPASAIKTVDYIQPISLSNIYKIRKQYGIIDSENYFTDWEIEQINESLSDYANGNYKTGGIDELLKDLRS
jgi:hypothetical protein